MGSSNLTRRQFLATASTGTLAAVVAGLSPDANAGKTAAKCAILGGQPVRAKAFQRWPVGGIGRRTRPRGPVSAK